MAILLDRCVRFLTSAHLWIVSGPTPPSTSMSNEGNWLLNQLTWVTSTEIKQRAQNLQNTISTTQFSNVKSGCKKRHGAADKWHQKRSLHRIWMLVRQNYCALVNKCFHLGCELLEIQTTSKWLPPLMIKRETQQQRERGESTDTETHLYLVLT